MESMSERRIVFTFEDDFAEIFERWGVDTASVTEEEWRDFEKMFMSGLAWNDVAHIAAAEVIRRRRYVAHR
jgi:hypothetical protein